MTRNRIIFGVFCALLASIIAYQAIERGVHSVRLVLAEEQCQIFAEMADRASAALDGQQPDLEAAIQCLEYTHNYYPSGTKQVTGSSLDSIVENARHTSEMRIIALLKAITESDLGNDANVWTEHFNK